MLSGFSKSAMTFGPPAAISGSTLTVREITTSLGAPSMSGFRLWVGSLAALAEVERVRESRCGMDVDVDVARALLGPAGAFEVETTATSSSESESSITTVALAFGLDKAALGVEERARSRSAGTPK